MARWCHGEAVLLNDARGALPAPRAQGLSGEAAEAQEYLVKMPNRIRKLAERAYGEHRARMRACAAAQCPVHGAASARGLHMPARALRASLLWGGSMACVPCMRSAP